MSEEPTKPSQVLHHFEAQHDLEELMLQEGALKPPASGETVPDARIKLWQKEARDIEKAEKSHADQVRLSQLDPTHAPYIR